MYSRIQYCVTFSPIVLCAFFMALQQHFLATVVSIKYSHSILCYFIQNATAAFAMLRFNDEPFEIMKYPYFISMSFRLCVITHRSELALDHVNKHQSP